MLTIMYEVPYTCKVYLYVLFQMFFFFIIKIMLPNTCGVTTMYIQVKQQMF